MNEIASELSNALAGAVDAAAGSIVRVEGARAARRAASCGAPTGVVLTAHHSLDRDETCTWASPTGARSRPRWPAATRARTWRSCAHRRPTCGRRPGAT